MERTKSGKETVGLTLFSFDDSQYDFDIISDSTGSTFKKDVDQEKAVKQSKETDKTRVKETSKSFGEILPKTKSATETSKSFAPSSNSLLVTNSFVHDSFDSKSVDAHRDRKAITLRQQRNPANDLF
jgi:hypothetical protein